MVRVGEDLTWGSSYSHARWATEASFPFHQLVLDPLPPHLRQSLEKEKTNFRITHFWDHTIYLIHQHPIPHPPIITTPNISQTGGLRN